jgi:hypothetical protein
LPKAVTIREIERIFSIIDPLGISREAVVIPLKAEQPGRVRRIAGGKFEIIVERDGDFDEWLRRLDRELRAMTGREPD